MSKNRSLNKTPKYRLTLLDFYFSVNPTKLRNYRDVFRLFLQNDGDQVRRPRLQHRPSLVHCDDLHTSLKLFCDISTQAGCSLMHSAVLMPYLPSTNDAPSGVQSFRPLPSQLLPQPKQRGQLAMSHSLPPASRKELYSQCYLSFEGSNSFFSNLYVLGVNIITHISSF